MAVETSAMDIIGTVVTVAILTMLTILTLFSLLTLLALLVNVDNVGTMMRKTISDNRWKKTWNFFHLIFNIILRDTSASKTLHCTCESGLEIICQLTFHVQSRQMMSFPTLAIPWFSETKFSHKRVSTISTVSPPCIKHPPHIEWKYCWQIIFESLRLTQKARNKFAFFQFFQCF